MKYVFKMFFLVYIILLSIHFCGCNKQQEELTTKIESTHNQEIIVENIVEINPKVDEMLISMQEEISIPEVKPYVICIDPGHQSKGNNEKEPIAPGASETKAKVSSGTSGRYTGAPEYKINLDVSLILKEELEDRGYTVIMTRDTNDVNISNSERAMMANNANADAFIRIHCNGSENPSANGMMTICPTANNQYCKDIYERSKVLSELILDNMIFSTGAKKEKVWETDTMSGINWSSVPVTIIEMGYMTNKEDDENLSNHDYQTRIVLGIANGLDSYFEVFQRENNSDDLEQ